MPLGHFPICIDCGARLPATTWRPRQCTTCQQKTENERRAA